MRCRRTGVRNACPSTEGWIRRWSSSRPGCPSFCRGSAFLCGSARRGCSSFCATCGAAFRSTACRAGVPLLCSTFRGAEDCRASCSGAGSCAPLCRAARCSTAFGAERPFRSRRFAPFCRSTFKSGGLHSVPRASAPCGNRADRSADIAPRLAEPSDRINAVGSGCGARSSSNGDGWASRWSGRESRYAHFNNGGRKPARPARNGCSACSPQSGLRQSLLARRQDARLGQFDLPRCLRAIPLRARVATPSSPSPFWRGARIRRAAVLALRL